MRSHREIYGRYVNKKTLTQTAFTDMIPKVMKMERFVEQTLLFDFYGDLLTEHQRSVYEDVVLGDLTYSEAAEEYGVSRQGVHELVKRCNHMMEEYEQKLHLVQKFRSIRDSAKELRQVSGRTRELTPEQISEALERISDHILEEL